MIRFFRNLRRSLAGTGNTGKYLKYALGEIILVVLGILIALQIDTRNQNRQDRRQEQVVLSQLLDEYTSNLEQLNSKMYIRREVIKSAYILLQYRKTEPDRIHPDSFNLYLSRVITRPTFDPVLGVTNELSNSGKLYLIRNATLRNRLASFSSLLNEVHEEEQVIFADVQTKFTPFIREQYQLGRVLSEFLQDEAFTSHFTLSTTQDYDNIRDMFGQTDLKPILQHPDFEDHLAEMITNTIYTNQQSQGVLEKIEEILALIRGEMGEGNEFANARI
jgi:hypothetical protein